MSAGTVRPTKKQKELLDFIDQFINERGYSPSYREIMTMLDYTSVATVSLHVNSLIQRGHLRKRDHAARSLEVVRDAAPAPEVEITVKKTVPATETQEKWLIEKVAAQFAAVEQDAKAPEAALDQLYVLVGALKVLGLDAAAQSFIPRLSVLKKRYTKSK